MHAELECWLAEEQGWVDRWIDQSYVDMAILGYVHDGPGLLSVDNDNVRSDLQPSHFATEIASKRAILDIHSGREDGVCRTCLHVVDGTPQPVPWPCDTIRALAIPLALGAVDVDGNA